MSTLDNSDLAYLSWLEAARRIRHKALSPVAYCEAQLARIEALDGKLNATLHVCAERALSRAHAAERALMSDKTALGETLGPLHGVPFALKDIIDVAGLPTTAHSQVMAQHVAAADAEVTRRLQAAGGIVLAKLSTHEFALGGPCFDLPWPPARNPWNTACMPGGSSSGSGAAVAAGYVPLALGTDTGGSVRNPASACGVVGIKPTYGLVSRRGVVPLSFSLDHVGPLTRTVEENAAALNILAGYDAADPGCAALAPMDYTRALGSAIAGLKIGVIRHFFARDRVASEAMGGAIDTALGVLESLGAVVADVSTRPLQAFADCNRIILLCEAYAVHEKDLRERPQDYAELTRQRLLPGAFLRAVDYVQALRKRVQLRDEMSALLHDYDVLITASSMEPAFPIKDTQACAKLYPRQARTPFNLTGHPAISVPIGFSAEGLPLAMQIVGRAFDEPMVYRVAAAYERETRWCDKHPPVD
ncbi:MAG: amidase [Gammaproteobacteria bacterium]|nr:amidase [Gammaproteobacteria bacterium]